MYVVKITLHGEHWDMQLLLHGFIKSMLGLLIFIFLYDYYTVVQCLKKKVKDKQLFYLLSFCSKHILHLGQVHNFWLLQNVPVPFNMMTFQTSW